MGKRARPEEEVTEYTPVSIDQSVEARWEIQPEPSCETVREELTAEGAVGESTQAEGVTIEVQVAAATSDEGDELEEGSSWAILALAGYTVW